MEKLPEVVEKGKTNAIISYITIIGTIVAYVLNSKDKNSFTSFHIRQMIGLGILSIINQVVIYGFIGAIPGGIIGVILFVLWVIGFIGVINGEEKAVPVIGEHFQEWFKSI